MDACGSRLILDYDRFRKSLWDLRICMSVHLGIMLVGIVVLMAMRVGVIAAMVMMTMVTVGMSVVSHMMTRYGRFSF